MASKIIVTTLCRASHVHLSTPHTFDATKPAKYKMEMMFAKNGVGVINKTGDQVESSAQNIKDAIDEVSMQEFGFAPSQVDPKQYGIQFPPNFKDGDQKLQKDSNGNPIPGSVDPITAGYEILAVTNENPVGVAAGNPIAVIDPSNVVSGYWVRCELEVSAYTSKAASSRIISVNLTNVLVCFDDEVIGRAPQNDATTAFNGVQVQNSNLPSNFGQDATTAFNGVQPMQPQAQQPMQPQAQQPMQPQAQQPMQPQAQQPMQPQQAQQPMQPQQAQQPMQPQAQQPMQPQAQQPMQPQAQQPMQPQQAQQPMQPQAQQPNYLEPQG